jgi:hypothetical protein
LEQSYTCWLLCFLQNGCLREPRVTRSHHITLDVSAPVFIYEYNKAIPVTDRGVK